MSNLRNGAWRAPLLALVFLASYALITLGFPAPLNSLASIKMGGARTCTSINKLRRLFAWLHRQFSDAIARFWFSRRREIRLVDGFRALDIVHFATASDGANLCDDGERLHARGYGAANSGAPSLPWVVLSCLALLPPLIFPGFAPRVLATTATARPNSARLKHRKRPAI